MKKEKDPIPGHVCQNPDCGKPIPWKTGVSKRSQVKLKSCGDECRKIVRRISHAKSAPDNHYSGFIVNMFLVGGLR